MLSMTYGYFKIGIAFAFLFPVHCDTSLMSRSLPLLAVNKERAMKTTARYLFITLFGLMYFGCSESDSAQNNEEKSGAEVTSYTVFEPGVTILSLNVERSIKVAYAEGEDVVIIEAVRGSLTPEGYRQDPTFPKYEMDTRITDREGRLLYLRRGGDRFVGPTWEDDLLVQDSMLPSPEGNRNLFALVAKAAQRIEAQVVAEKGASTAAQMLYEIKAIKSFGNSALASIAASDEEIIQKFGSLDVQDFIPLAGGGGSLAGDENEVTDFSRGYYFLGLHEKTTLVIAHHTATRIHKYNAGSYTYFDFCNHGTCPSDMTQDCTLSMVEKPDWAAYTCQTDYDAFSNDGHNCHDDSRVQMASFVYGKTNTGSQYWCGDGNSSTDFSAGTEAGYPTCSDSSRSGYNHPDMYNYSETNTNSALQYTTNYSVVLSAGATYTISTCDTTDDDTYLRLFNGTTQVSSSDDGCGLQSKITYTPTHTATYSIHAGCYGSGSCTAKVNVNLVSSNPSPRYYVESNTDSAQQYTTNYSVSLTAGKTYEIATCDNSSTDTFLRLFDSAGSQVTYSDDGCGLQSKMTVTPSVSGTFSIHAGCYGSSSCNGTVVVTQL